MLGRESVLTIFLYPRGVRMARGIGTRSAVPPIGGTDAALAGGTVFTTRVSAVLLRCGPAARCVAPLGGYVQAD
jgi:hypothetical protein